MSVSRKRRPLSVERYANHVNVDYDVQIICYLNIYIFEETRAVLFGRSLDTLYSFVSKTVGHSISLQYYFTYQR